MRTISKLDTTKGRAAMSSSRRIHDFAVGLPLPQGEGRGEGGQANLPMRSRTSRAAAYTLIELLIVISIIAILAALILTVTGAVNRSKIRAKARAEMAGVVMGIENYKTKMGHYPPDTPNASGVGVRTDINSLYFELCGTTNSGGVFRTLDGTAAITVTPVNQFALVYGPNLSSIINCSARTGGDEASVGRRFIAELKPGQVATWNGLPDVKFLVCSIPSPYQNPQLSPPTANIWHYVSSNPTNNPNSFDLWVDVKVGDKTNRICNWSREPLIVALP